MADTPQFRREVYRATTMDKSEWGPGPWQDEPDRVRWRWRGFSCLVNRSDVSGSLCGYVGVPPEHPFFGRDYSEIDADVHWGLTFAGVMGDDVYQPEPDEPARLWWLGFDTAHSGDATPKMQAYFRQAGMPANDRRILRDEYRSFVFVVANIAALCTLVARYPLRPAPSRRALARALRRARRTARKDLVRLAGAPPESKPPGFPIDRGIEMRFAAREASRPVRQLAAAHGVPYRGPRLPRSMRHVGARVVARADTW